jgi:ABC-2 type transport system ATP-binding protein
MNPLVSAKHVSKRYAQQTALDNISFELKAGQVLGLLGHNGSGKSSLINALIGGHRYQGDISVNGLHPIKQHAQMMQHLAYISDVNVLPEWMTVKQILKYTAGVHPSFDIEKAYATLNKTKIKHTSKIKTLSKGMKVQLHLAIVIATDTKVLILDEPTLGLDLLYRDTFYRHLVEWFHDGDRALIIASHEVSEIEHLLTDVLVLKQGKAVMQSSIEQIADDYFILDAANIHSAEIEKLAPLCSKVGLGSVRWLLDSLHKTQVETLGDIYPVGLADLFIALQKDNA